MITAIVFYLILSTGNSVGGPAVIPVPYDSIKLCNEAGDVWAAVSSYHKFACIPTQRVVRHQTWQSVPQVAR